MNYWDCVEFLYLLLGCPFEDSSMRVVLGEKEIMCVIGGEEPVVLKSFNVDKMSSSMFYMTYKRAYEHAFCYNNL